ncbi:MAG: response regulator transcription factor [Actinobacteria bacterium]|nr:response regulator transcription factor [Actinomycetota bacterium]
MAKTPPFGSPGTRNGRRVFTMDSQWLRRVLLVDDDPLMTRLLRDVLEGKGFEVASAASAAEARDALVAFDPDIALVDLELGGGPSGVDMAHLIHERHPGVVIIILTRYPDLATAGFPDATLPPGTGFVRKDLVEEPDQIVAAIDAVVAERTDEVRHDRDGARAFDMLTPAQLEVLTLMAQGFDNDAIATRRGCSVSSVANLIAEIYRRLGIDPRGELNPRVEAVRQFAQAAGMPERTS